MNDVSVLRKHLFDTIDGIKQKTISIEQAKAITEVSQAIINSAKVEVEYAKATGGQIASGFLPEKSTATGITMHKLRG